VIIPRIKQQYKLLKSIKIKLHSGIRIWSLVSSSFLKILLFWVTWLTKTKSILVTLCILLLLKKIGAVDLMLVVVGE